MPACCLRNDEHPHWTILGDPTEAALRVAAAKGGIDLRLKARRTPRIRELPFDSRRKRMSTIHQDGRPRWFTSRARRKEMLALCTHLRRDGEERRWTMHLAPRDHAANDKYARDGLRVLAVRPPQRAR